MELEERLSSIKTKFDPGKSFLQLLVYLGSPKHGPAEPVCLHFNNRDLPAVDLATTIESETF